MLHRFTLFAAALALSMSLSARLCAQQAYTLTDIAAWTTEGDTSIAHINASGQIAGYAPNSSGVGQAYLWTPVTSNAASGTLSFLPLTEACAINGPGQVAGYGQVVLKGRKSAGYAQVWQPDGTITNLISGGKAFGINDAGNVVGQAFGASTYPFLWSHGMAYDLYAQTGGARATSINQSGQIAGLDANFATGFLWTPSTPNGTTGTSIHLPIAASAINDLGQVVGPPSTIMGQAALYTPSGGVQYLPGSNASGINNLTQVVGAAYTSPDPSLHAYLWDSVHGARNLNDSSQFILYNSNGTFATGWFLFQADGINDYGQIVGWGINSAGQRRIFLLTPR